jgi:apolipoprotein N-acyltransferase
LKISRGIFTQSRFPLAIVAGLLLAFSFPNIEIAGLAWIAPGLMLAAALGKRGAESFRIGYAAGLVHYLASLSWLLLIPYRWHGIPLGPAFGWIALSAYLAIFPGVWVWLALQVSSSAEREKSWLGTFEEISLQSWSYRMLWALYCAASWVALEMIVVRLFGGFPWNLLGASQFRLVPLIQIASITGIHGVSFLVVWTSVSLLCALIVLVRRPTVRSAWLGEMILSVVTIMVLFAFGFRHLSHLPAPARELKVALVQPSIPQTLIWDPAEDMNRFRQLMRLSEQAVTNRPDLLIWPEAALPRLIRYDADIRLPVLKLAREHQVWMIIGSDDAEARAKTPDPDDADYFNASFLISPRGELAARYCKRDLVIFGEYIPLTRWLPFLKWFTPVQSGFTPGKQAVQFEMTDLKLKTSPLICYEDTFPQTAREAAADGADFLVNLTNDGWFGEGAAQWQQAGTSVFRAVENGLPLVRCANSGVTCWIDEAGRIRETFLDQNGRVYGSGFAIMTVLLPENRPRTFYHERGDVFGWGCVAVSVGTVACGFLTRRKA